MSFIYLLKYFDYLNDFKGIVIVIILIIYLIILFYLKPYKRMQHLNLDYLIISISILTISITVKYEFIFKRLNIFKIIQLILSKKKNYFISEWMAYISIILINLYLLLYLLKKIIDILDKKYSNFTANLKSKCV